mmetsp:Transcript_5994/g.13202  ORF Transcript_5994/g.13202 Transcript_5994/m.13202 type:complete len:265 (-) Transcript_5994:97-891(-)
MLDDPIAAIGVSIHVDHRAREGSRHVGARPPAREGARVPSAVPRQAGRIERHVRVRGVPLVRARLVDEVGLALVRVVHVGSRTVLSVVGILVEVGVDRDGLQDLVDPGGIVVPLGRDRLAVPVGEGVTVDVPARPDADGPGPVADGVVVGHDRLEVRLLEGDEVGEPVGVGVRARPVEAEGRGVGQLRGSARRRVVADVGLHDVLEEGLFDGLEGGGLGLGGRIELGSRRQRGGGSQRQAEGGGREHGAGREREGDGAFSSQRP